MDTEPGAPLLEVCIVMFIVDVSGRLTRAHCSTGAGSGASYSFWYTSRNAASLYLALQAACCQLRAAGA